MAIKCSTDSTPSAAPALSLLPESPSPLIFSQLRRSHRVPISSRAARCGMLFHPLNTSMIRFSLGSYSSSITRNYI
uniref:Uncharacterized protein n=1 Tax=Arundo donax TaxID=35708 RepID=A0A0A9HDB2_ARUDO